MKAILICGSPREEGNTEYLLNHCANVLKDKNIEAEVIQLAGKEIKGCLGCGWCRKNEKLCCIQDQDDFLPIFKKMLESDIIILGSPVYFGSATPEIMALIDRAGFIGRSNQLFARKIGAAITVGRRAGQNFTFSQLCYWFLINNMIVPGSSYWNVASAGAIGTVQDDAEAITTVTDLADNIAWLSEKIG